MMLGNAALIVVLVKINEDLIYAYVSVLYFLNSIYEEKKISTQL